MHGIMLMTSTSDGIIKIAFGEKDTANAIMIYPYILTANPILRNNTETAFGELLILSWVIILKLLLVKRIVLK